ncbi:hypothetical protein U879_14940 [Defluviimonas sp. 20V17]|uniref:Uncharacterized protein n=1 Tax=Allgaiera indica TaxID=765699 RepID=A0AAN4ZZ23_9RHOB|nr:hypothetical protein [Allgaiera indica]KDB02880.1 hypothetical protein U879_14940 [Defluviimonas sp. 20V17]GHE01380.1 hypothetical protein GCM10008024_16620 [Allgaiera indica]SDW85779.1 hypothetical protein SAMN05444006_107124 [Allgaiera indica]
MSKLGVIVEYAAVDWAEDTRAQYTVFDEAQYGNDPYWGPIIERLKASNGLYVFYDSLARPLYVGIAPTQPIWDRANQSYNKYRDRQLKIPGVVHPVGRGRYDATKTRKISRSGFSLADVAYYFSAYEVSKDLIGGLEAFAIRAFGGVLLNTKFEGNGKLSINMRDK